MEGRQPVIRQRLLHPVALPQDHLRESEITAGIKDGRFHQVILDKL